MDLRLSVTHILLAAFLGLGVYTALQFAPPSSVTVVGEAKSQQKTQVATYTAGVSSVSDDKDAAVSEVNKKMDTIIQAVKDFGIKSEDIKTQNLSVYQMEQPYYEEGVQKTKPGQWRVSNDISVKLKDVNRASELADLLTKSGATNVYGPSFTTDDTQEAEVGLVDQAIKNATEKADAIAKASGKKLGKVITVSEGSSSSGIYPFISEKSIAGGGGSSVEPGSQTVSKSVTVTFELD
jgi:uncharacterized protein